MKIKYLLILFVILLLKPVYSNEQSDYPIGDIEEIQDKLEENSKVGIIVWLKDNEFTSPEYQENLDIKKEEIRKIQDKVLSKLTEEDFIIKYKYMSTNGFAGAVSKSGFEKLLNDGNVAEIYLDREVKAFLSESRPLIKADIVENNLGINGSGVTVCVLDSGVDYTHINLGGCTTSQFLSGNCNKVVGGFDFCNGMAYPPPEPPLHPCSGPTDPDPMDEHGHGTHVAGIIASDDSIFGYRGIAPGAKLAAVKVLNASGDGTFGALAAGIDWCNTNANLYNIKIITMSLGDNGQYPPNCPTLINNPIQDAFNAGIFLDASSGNQGYTSGISYPACAPGVTSVGAVYDENFGTYISSTANCTDYNVQADQISCFTNRGTNLDLLAPGARITSTVSSQGNVCGAPFSNGYNTCSGTSMAAPHVAGVAALLKQVRTNLTPLQIKNILKNTGTNIFDPNTTNTSLIFKRIDALAAINSSLMSLIFHGSPLIGSTRNITISDPLNPNVFYILAISFGTNPGINVFGNIIPLNYDGLFILSLFYPTTIGLINSQGYLDNNGKATITWNIPNVPAFSGYSVNFAFIVINTSLPVQEGIVGISQPISIQLITCTVPTSSMSISSNTTLCSGNYYFPYSNFNIINIAQSNVYLDCNGATLIGLTPPPNFLPSNAIGITTVEDGVEIRNCNLKNYNIRAGFWSPYYPIFYDHVSNLLIENNTIENGGIYVLGDYNINSNNRVIKNKIKNGYMGIRVRGNNSVIEDNSISGGYGIYVGPPNGGILRNSIINRNFLNNTINGILISNGENNYITNNVLSNTSGILVYDDNYKIINNTIINRGMLLLSGGGQYTAENTTVIDNIIQNAEGVIITTNNNILNSNVVENNQKGIQLGYFSSSFGLFFAANNNQLISNNICFNSNYDINNSISNINNIGTNNKCSTTFNWNDTGYSGCTYTC